MKLLANVEDNHIVYETCKRLGIQSLNIIGSDIYPSDSVERIKKGSFLVLFKVGYYGLEEVKRA